MLMESRAVITRGWPADGSRERVEPIAASTTLVNGDFVTKDASGNLIKTTGITRACGLVVRGNGDSAACANTNTAVVVWGNCVVSLSGAGTLADGTTAASTYAASGSWAPGAMVASAASGQVQYSAGAVTDIGFVLEVVAATAGVQTVHLNVCLF